jgi:hypothetical protein
MHISFNVNEKPRKGQLRGSVVVIDCITSINRIFVDLFVSTLESIEPDSFILVQLKRAKVRSSYELGAIAASLQERRLAGGQAAFVAETSQLRQMLKRSGVPDGLIADSIAEPVGRTIILAER